MTTSQDVKYQETAYGFSFGSAEVQRIASCPEKKWVVLEVKSSKHRVQLYVTKTGKVRIFKDGVEV